MGIGSRLLKNTTYLTVGNQIGTLLQFLFFLFFARHYGQIIVGQYSFVFSFTYLLSVFADLGLSAYIIREVAKKNDNRQIFVKCLTLRLLSIALFFSLGTITILIFPEKFYGNTIIIFLLLGGYHVFFSIADVFLAEFTGHDRMGLVAILTIFLRFIITCPAIFLIFLGFDFLIVLICFPVGSFLYLVACIFFSYYYFKNIKLYFRDLYLKKLFIEILPFAFAIFFTSALYHQDILILKFLKNDQIVGIFSAASRVILALLGVLVFIYTAMLPTFSRLYVDSRSKLVEISEQSLRYFLLISLPMATGLYAISDEVIVLFFSDSFKDSVSVLRILSWTIPFCFALIPYSVLLTAIDRQAQKVIAIGVGLSLNILINLIIIPKFSYNGAAFAKLIAEALLFIMMAYLVSKYFVTLSLHRYFLKPFIASFFMYIFLSIFSQLSLIWLILLASLVYSLSLIALRGYEKDEIEFLKGAYSRIYLNAKGIIKK
ncbi:MAG: flippase [Thermodesulfobacteriota bacterium]|nr:flippase [Thermodesulfobacteriota bacterium]